MTQGRVVTEESTEWCWGQGGIKQGDLCLGSREKYAWGQVSLSRELRQRSELYVGLICLQAVAAGVAGERDIEIS